MVKLLPEYITHKTRGVQNYFWFDEHGTLLYGPDENNLHYPSYEEAYERFHVAAKDLERAFKLGAGITKGD